MSAALFGEAVLWSWDFAHGLSWPPEGPVNQVVLQWEQRSLVVRGSYLGRHKNL